MCLLVGRSPCNWTYLPLTISPNFQQHKPLRYVERVRCSHCGGMVKEITAPEAAAQTLSDEQISDLFKQLEDALGAKAVAQSALETETKKSADLQKENTKLQAEVAKFSKLPAAQSIKNGATVDKNQLAKKVQISDEQLAKLSLRERTYIAIQNLKHNN